MMPSVVVDCIERAGLAELVRSASTTLTQTLQREAEVVISGDAQRMREIEAITAQYTALYHAVVETYLEHLARHGCMELTCDALTIDSV